MTDKELFDKINSKDISAFRYLYMEYYGVLCVYAGRFTKNREISREVVQDVFLKLWEQSGRIMIQVSIRAYLFTSVRNHCLDHLKHLQIVHKYEEYFSRLLQDAEDLYFFSQESGDALLMAREFETSLQKEISNLPEQCRKIFTMSRLEGMRHVDIAQKLGIAQNTVQRQVSIALEKLRQALKNYLPIFLSLL